MNWKNLKVGAKLGIGFAIVLILVVVVVIISYNGVVNLGGSSGIALKSSQLNTLVSEKEVDHHVWAGKVSALLMNENITTLEVETDDHKCSLGIWLYGKERKEAEEVIPSLKPLFKAVEKPHYELHASAIDIGKTFIPGDLMLPSFLRAKEVDHLKWAAEVQRLFLQNLPELKVQTDDHKCALGKWLYGVDIKKQIEGKPELARLIGAIKEPHRKLHESAIEIQNLYRQIHPGLLNTLKDRLDDHRRWAAKVSKGLVEGRKSLDVELDPNKCAYGKFLQSEQARNLMQTFPAFRAAVESSIEPHKRLHESAQLIEKALKAGNPEQAQKYYTETSLPALDKVGGYFAEAIKAENDLASSADAAQKVYDTKASVFLKETRSILEKIIEEGEYSIAGMLKAQKIYDTTTIPSLRGIQRLLAEIKEEARKKGREVENELGKTSKGTKRYVLILGVLALFVGMLLAFFISRAISKPIIRMADTVVRIGQNRDLTLEVPVESKDEIGTMSKQFNEMMQVLRESFKRVTSAAGAVAEGAVEVAQRATANRDRAEVEVGQTEKSAQIITEMGGTAGEVAQSSEAQREAAELSNTTVTDLVKAMGEVTKSAADQNKEANASPRPWRT
jgi:methyl-accepting chemotaxis protein